MTETEQWFYHVEAEPMNAEYHAYHVMEPLHWRKIFNDPNRDHIPMLQEATMSKANINWVIDSTHYPLEEELSMFIVRMKPQAFGVDEFRGQLPRPLLFNQHFVRRDGFVLLNPKLFEILYFKRIVSGTAVKQQKVLHQSGMQVDADGDVHLPLKVDDMGESAFTSRRNSRQYFKFTIDKPMKFRYPRNMWTNLYGGVMPRYQNIYLLVFPEHRDQIDRGQMGGTVDEQKAMFKHIELKCHYTTHQQNMPLQALPASYYGFGRGTDEAVPGNTGAVDWQAVPDVQPTEPLGTLGPAQRGTAE